METVFARVLTGLTGLAALFTALLFLLVIEEGPCHKTGAPEFFTNPRIPLSEKAGPSLCILAPAGAGGVLLYWALRRSRRPGDASGSPR